MASAWRLKGRLDIGALEGALHRIVRRHEVLRTHFPTRGERPSQVISPEFNHRLPVVDLGRLARLCHRREARLLADATAARPFDLARGPLLRATLVRLGDEKHVLLLTLHHIVSDAWSQGNFNRELATFYSMGRHGKSVGCRRAPELPVQYADYALWQRGWLHGATLDAQLAYWRKQLANLQPLRLPTDRPRGTARSERGGCVPLVLPGSLTESLKQLSSGAGASLFMSLLAGFAALLSRLSGLRDIAVGSPIASRGQAEVESLIGMFANTLVYRTDLSSDNAGPNADPITFRQLLERVRHTALDAYARQDTPFERLVEALRPARSPHSSPLFQVMFVLQNTPISPLRLAELECVAVEGAPPSAKFDLSLSLRETGQTGDLAGEIVYKADLFDRTRIQRMASHLKMLLDTSVRDPDCPLEHLSLLSAAEHQQIMVEWNDTRVDETRGPRCLHQLFERQAACTPDTIALVFGDQRVSYRQLDEHADRLAATLLDLGIGRGDVVPVLMSAGLEVPIALLAIMKSGAAYSPLDVKWPRQRTAKILDDLGSKVVLVNVSFALFRRDESACVPLRVEASVSVWSTPNPPRRPSTVALEDPIYAIYTSGSTGEPKASVNTHGGIVNRFLWMDRQYGRALDRVVLQTTYHTFDSSVWQLFWPLLHGARSVLLAMHEGYDLDQLIAIIEQENVTFSDFVPSAFDLLVDRLEHRPRQRRRVASLRHLIIGGEAINLRAIDRFRSFFPRVGFTNLYGPTEAAIGVIFYRISEGPSAPIPIGRPIDNVAVLILDSELASVPVGVPGEIYLGGVCVGLGYLGDPERSARVFIDNPFPGIRSSKLYKTGDLARYRADGNIEFLGRADHQIKIRGFRIEPSEIEGVLAQHPAVIEAAVVVRQDPPRGSMAGDRRLVAYIVPRREGQQLAAISGVELRTVLERNLPGYMVPSELMVLEALPLAAGGKVDRVALRQSDELPGRVVRLESVHEGAASTPVAPRTQIEEQLVAIWSEVLGRQDIGIHDDFFAAGGHSLLAVRLMTRIERRFRVQLPLATLFDQPTIEGLARRVAQGDPPTLSSPLVPIRSVASIRHRAQPPFFCVHPVGGQVLCYQQLAEHCGLDQPFYGLQAQGRDVREALDLEIADMAARYLDAIQSVQPHGPYRLGGWSMGGAIAFEIASRLCRQGEDIDALVLIDTSAPSIGQPTDGSDPASRLGAFARNLLLAPVNEQPTGLGLDESLRRILDRARLVGSLSADDDLERLRDLYRLFEDNLRALRRYIPSPYPGRITLLKSSQRRQGSDLTLGWSQLAGGGVEVDTVPGDHFTMLREPHVRVLAKRLEACLAVSSHGSCHVAIEGSSHPLLPAGFVVDAARTGSPSGESS